MADILPFSANITEETLIASGRLHNQFAPDTAFPQIDADGFEELCSIIAKYNVQRHFRLRLLHRHTTIPEGQILLGSRIKEPSGYWTRPTPISAIDLQNIHPHIISIDKIGYMNEDEMKIGLLLPSEFREGPPARAESNDAEFVTEFTNCLRARGLENTLGLEVIQGRAGKMVEFSFDIGSLLLEEGEVTENVREERRGQFTLQETGWTIAVKDGTVLKTGETRCVTFPSGHIKVTDSKIMCLSDAVKILRKDGLLA